MHALDLLATPLVVQVLWALGEQPRSLTDLRRVVGLPPQTTVRDRLRRLSQTRLLDARRESGFPGSVEYALSPAGRRFAEVAGSWDSWLGQCPGEECPLGGAAAKGVLKALAGAWSTGLLRALAARPLALTDLGGLIKGLNYPALERRLGALRLAGLVEAVPAPGRRTPYAPTEWMRRAAGPLASAAAWEREHVATSDPPLGRIDVEALFLLALPLLRLEGDRSGCARLAVQVPGRDGRRLAGVMVEVEGGRIRGCAPRLEGKASGWAVGGTGGWLSALCEEDLRGLEIGGDAELARSLVEGLGGELFEGLRNRP